MFPILTGPYRYLKGYPAFLKHRFLPCLKMCQIPHRVRSPAALAGFMIWCENTRDVRERGGRGPPLPGCGGSPLSFLLFPKELWWKCTSERRRRSYTMLMGKDSARGNYAKKAKSAVQNAPLSYQIVEYPHL